MSKEVLLLIAVLIFPVGPSVDTERMEREILAALSKAQQEGSAPPGSLSGTNHVDCSTPLVSTNTVTCDIHQDIAFLPDGRTAVNSNIREENGRVCWTVESFGDDDDFDNPSEAFFASDELDGCS